MGLDITNDELKLLYEAVCERLADYVHHYPDEFIHNGGDLNVYNKLYGKVYAECKERFWWAR